jgi:hypothetical protein
MNIAKNAFFWDVAPCRKTLEIHGATSQKTAFFIFIDVKTSDITQCTSCVVKD